MNLRRLLPAFAIGLAVVLHASPASAQERVSRLVLPVPAGGLFDMLGRALAPRLGGDWIVENKPGAETMIGSEYVARAAPDGRTMLMAGATLVLAPLTRNLAFVPAEELRPVVQVSYSDFMLVVPPDSPIRSVADLAPVAAARPNGLNCGAPPGAMGLACAQLGARLGGRLTAIPYPGNAPAVTATLGGHVDILFVSSETAAPLVASGKLRALASTSPAFASAHRVPLFTQAWPGFLMEGFTGVFVPKATPDEEVKRLAAAVNRVLADPAFLSVLRDAGQQPAGGTPEQFAAHVKDVRGHYAELVRKLNLAPPN